MSLPSNASLEQVPLPVSNVGVDYLFVYYSKVDSSLDMY